MERLSGRFGPAIVVAVAILAWMLCATGTAQAAPGDILVTDSGSFSDGRVIRVDPVTGELETISSNDMPDSGPDFVFPSGIAIDGDDVFVTERFGFDAPGGVMRVDPETGRRSLFSYNETSTGGPFSEPVGIAIEAGGDLLVVDRSAFGGAVIRVDRETGEPTTLSTNASPEGGPGFEGPTAIAVAADGAIYVTDIEFYGQSARVIRVDPVSGARTLVSSNAAPDGEPQFSSPSGIAIDANGDLLVTDATAFVVDDSSTGGVIRVDPRTGARTVVSANDDPRDIPNFGSTEAIAIADDGDLLVANTFDAGGERSAGNVIEVFPATGRRSTLSRDGDRGLRRPSGIAVGPPTADVVVDSAPAVVGPGAPLIAFSELVDEPEALGDSTGETIAGSPLRSSPLRSSPLRSSPLRSSPLRSSPLRSSPLRSSALGPIMLVELPLRSSSWEELLAGTTLNGPVNAITLDQVYLLSPLPPAIEALTLADIDLERSPLRSSALGALLLGEVTLDKLAPPPDYSWCALLGFADDDPACDLDGETLISAQQKVPHLVEEYLKGPVALNGPGVDVSDSTLATIRVEDVDIERTPLAGRDLGSAVTIGDVLEALPLGNLDVLYLADLVPGLVAPNNFPFELAPLDDVLANAPLRDEDPVTYTVTTSIVCDTTTMSYEVRLPRRARYLPGTARATFPGGSAPLADPADTSTPTLTFDTSAAVQTACGPLGRTVEMSLEFDAEAPSRLGAPTLSARVRVEGRSRRGSGTDTRVNDVDDPGETPQTAAQLPANAILSGYVADEQDVDAYRLRAPAPGSVVRVVLSHLPADYDVTVTGPPVGIESAPLRSSPLRSSPLRSSPLRDDLDERSETRTPDTLQDIPLRSSDLEATPLRSSSINRSMEPESASFTVTEADHGKDFVVRVTGFNGASSDEPYVLRTEVVEPPPIPPCRADRSLGAQARGAFPSLPLPAATKTVILVNQRRLKQLYPTADIAALRTQLSTLAARSEVGGVVVPVESDPARDTDAAYAAWDADPCSVEKANAVGSDVLEVLKHVATGLNQLRHVVIVGGDEVIPQVRVPDLTTIANEREEAGSLVFGGKDTAASRALREGFILTDDAYGDADPQAWLGGETFVPDIAVGRLVEKPAQIAAQLTQYTSSSGKLSEASTHVAGYDFLSDGATKVLEQLSKVTPAGKVSSDISETWTAAQAETALNRPTPGFSSVNAHYDHYRALPAAAFNGSVPDLLRAATVAPKPGSLLFTAGCHAGLNVNDVGAPDATGPDGPRLLDWTEKIASSQAVYVANTTYGYGDTEAVAYSERLLELFAEGIASRQATAGQALMIAKQRYAAELLTPGVYDVKAAQGLTFYGLPFFRVGATGAEAPSVLPKLPSGSATRATRTFAVTPNHSAVDTDRGRFYTADGQRPQVSHFRPIQPRVTIDVTPTDGLNVHGAVVEALESTEEFGVDPVFSRPTIDKADAEPEISSQDSVFPASIQRTTLTAATNGLRDLLVLVSGQFQTYPGSSQGIQRLFDRIAGTVYRSGSNDFDPPILRDISGRVTDGEATFRAASDDPDVIRGVVLFREDGTQAWRTAEMARVGSSDVWQATADVEGFRVEAFTIQLVDAAGNVGVSTNKGPGYVPLPNAGERGEPQLLREPDVPASGFHTGPVTLTIDPRDSEGETFMVSIDGAAPTVYAGPFTVSGDGRHEVSFTGSDGSAGSTVVTIDATPPRIKPVIAPAPSAEGFNSGPVTVSWQCTDAFSGVATCPPPVTVTTEGANQTITSGPATDVAGNRSTATARVSIDLRPPAVTIKRPTFSIGFFHLLLSARMTGTATDAVAGVRSVVVQYTNTFGGRRVNHTATLSCTNATRRSCTWSAPSPGLGFWRVVATATDRAGRTASATLPNVLSILRRR